MPDKISRFAILLSSPYLNEYINYRYDCVPKSGKDGPGSNLKNEIFLQSKLSILLSQRS